MAAAPVKWGQPDIRQALPHLPGLIDHSLSRLLIHQLLFPLRHIFDELAWNRLFIFAEDHNIGHVVPDQGAGAEGQAPLGFVLCDDAVVDGNIHLRNPV